MHFEEFFTAEGLVILLLFIATVVGIISQRLKVPYPIGLVIAGLVLAPLEQQLVLAGEIEFSIGPELILGLLVPPLVFEAAFHLKFDDLRQNLKTILMLAIPGVAITMVIVGGVVSFSTGLALSSSMLFGALVAATDPVAVIALFRTMGVPKRLQVLLEGESLFNDGTAIVIFNIVLALVLENTSFELGSGLVEFITVAGGGILVGVMLGLLVSLLISRITQPLIEATLTTVLAYGAYSLAELLGVSGVLAVVAAGVVGGNFGRRRMSPTTDIVVSNLWEFAAFIANSFVFLAIGLEIQFSDFAGDFLAIFWALVAILLARSVVIFGLTWVDKTPRGWQRVMFWGGLRGAISLALLLSLPAIEGRGQIQSMTFGVVLFTLLVQGYSMRWLVDREGLSKRKSETQEEYERRHARVMAARSSYEHLQQMNSQGLLSEYTWETIAPTLRQNIVTMTNALARIIRASPEVQSDEFETAWREKLRAERRIYNSLLSAGVVTEETYTQLVSDVDIRLSKGFKGWSEMIQPGGTDSQASNYLMLAVIQEQDVDRVSEALTSLGISTNRLSSQGGFGGAKNSTVLVNVPEDKLEIAIRTLEATCVNRVDFVKARVAPLPMLARRKITVGGATLFILDVEHYEEF